MISTPKNYYNLTYTFTQVTNIDLLYSCDI